MPFGQYVSNMQQQYLTTAMHRRQGYTTYQGQGWRNDIPLPNPVQSARNTAPPASASAKVTYIAPPAAVVQSIPPPTWQDAQMQEWAVESGLATPDSAATPVQEAPRPERSTFSRLFLCCMNPLPNTKS